MVLIVALKSFQVQIVELKKQFHLPKLQKLQL